MDQFKTGDKAPLTGCDVLLASLSRPDDDETACAWCGMDADGGQFCGEECAEEYAEEWGND